MKKLGIIPFRDFWIDCYSTAIYSILLSYFSTDKCIVYNNNYVYKLSNAVYSDDCIFWSIAPEVLIIPIEKNIFVNVEWIDLSSKNNIIECIKEYCNQEKILLLGVDLYEWVSDNFHWHRNHINHHALINGYDEVKEKIFVLETGEHGYMEYELSYSEVEKAVLSFSGTASGIFDINKSNPKIRCSYNDIIENSINIIESIDNILAGDIKPFNFYDLESEQIRFALDHIQTHLYSIESRQKANCLLIKSSFILKEDLNPFINGFARLQTEYSKFKNSVLKLNSCDKTDNILAQYQSWILNLLSQERSLWEHFITHKDFSLRQELII